MAEPKVPKAAKVETLHVPTHVDLPSESEDDRPLNTVEQRKQRGKKMNNNSSPELELNILLKFIKPYDGSRETLNSFLINCNNAYDLATEAQKSIVFKYILCQLSGKAEVACSIKEFISWEQLKDFLKNQFSVRKHYSHLLMELQECKQGLQESVSQFSLRIETCLSQLLTEISLSTSKVKEIAGRTAAMEELALHHFLIGLHPRISNITRCRSPRTLNEATNIAISEERIQQTLYKSTPRLMTELTKPMRSSFRPKSLQNFQNPQPFAPNQTNLPKRDFPSARNQIICRYCKNIGHSIENCRKREYNNRMYNQPSSSRAQQRVNFTHEHVEPLRDEINGDDEKNYRMSHDGVV